MLMTANAASSTYVLILWIVLFGGVMYFTMYRPQKKEQKRVAAMVSSMEVGDVVVTTSGFYGVLIDITDDDVIVERIHEEAKTEEKENDKGEKEVVEVSPAKDKVKINKRPVSLSDPEPLWMKHPNSCTDEEYKEFYRKVFMDYKEPLFWIHLNMDYPFNLKGILYFPKINTEYDSI